MFVIGYVQLFLFISYVYIQQKGAIFGIGVVSQNLTGICRWDLKYYSSENVNL